MYMLLFLENQHVNDYSDWMIHVMHFAVNCINSHGMTVITTRPWFMTGDWSIEMVESVSVCVVLCIWTQGEGFY